MHFLEVKSQHEKEIALKKKIENDQSSASAASSYAASADISSITTSTQLSGVALRKRNKAKRQQKSREKKKNLVKKDKYSNILAIGVEYENKFSEEIKERLDNNLDKHDYQYAEKKTSTLAMQ